MKICLVTSAGGHFFQLFQLRKIWENYDHFWVTFNKPDVISNISKDKKYFAFYPESRNSINAIKNLFLAYKVLRKEHPKIVISTGAGITIPFFIISKLLKINTIYIEPLDFITSPSLSGKLIYKFQLANLFLIQNQLQKQFFPKSKYWGSTL